ncbi:putative sensor-like histidine kinase YedV [bacterium BMS3Abin03]|nr:putative sensor-like histidine kinase YedV [bacterium BMS3Abin03]
MKLIKKINRYFLTISVLIFIIISIITFFILQALISEEVDETLISERNNIVKKLQVEGILDSVYYSYSEHIEIKLLDHPSAAKEQLIDTLIFVGAEGESVPFRQLNSTVNINGKTYSIVLRHSLIEKDEITGLGIMIVLVFIAIIGLIGLINYLGERRLWKPFYNTINKLSGFSIKQKEPLDLPPVDIDEFNELNKTLNYLTEKLKRDYHQLKEFSENASHEMQTPLAVIRSKLDVLIQDNTLSEYQHKSISSLYNAVSRLSRLNQSLNLLTKIENKEFDNKTDIFLTELTNRQLDNLKELIEINNLTVEKKFTAQPFLKLNRFIAESLFGNLIINAIKHNIDGGKISIEINKNKFSVTNTGKQLNVNPEELFRRFKKGDSSSGSPGLGLSIVQKICEQNNIDIKYTIIQNLHAVTLTF